MARRPRASQLETRTARLELPVRLKPHEFTSIAPSIALGYRRCQGPGRWVVRVADGHGGNWTKVVGLADDHEDADGDRVLTWWQASDKARALARGSDADSGRPATVADAIDAYERDLAARGAATVNASTIRGRLSATLAAKPVGLLTARELAAWRDAQLATGLRPASVVRLAKSLKAALNLAARRDHRITNRAAWTDGLGGLAEDFSSRNVQRLTDDQVRSVMAAAYEIDDAFGRYVEVAAITGARVSQIARLEVADLQANYGAPRLMMPSSRKGRGRKPSRYAVAITPSLAARLKRAVGPRSPSSPLLLRSDGAPWQARHVSDHGILYARASERAGITGTMTALRHSSITRALLRGVPTRVVAATHDTSVPMIEKTYSAFIADFADALTRAALLEDAPPAENVVPLRKP
jgi:integrase